MNAFTAAAITNVAIVALTGFVFWLTRSPWSFLLLALMFNARTRE